MRLRPLPAFALATAIGCTTASAKPPATTPPAAAPATSIAATTPRPAVTSSAYPPARRDDTVDTLHGTRMPDPYRWLEQLDSPETRAWLTAENRLTDAYLAAIPGKDALRRRVAELNSQESFMPPLHYGGRYFWTHRDGRQNQPLVESSATLDGTPTVVLDPNRISTDGSQAFAGFAVDHDGRRLAYGLAAGGGDWLTWRIRDLASGRDLADTLTNIKYYRPVFTRDGSGLYYSRFPAPPPGKELTEPDHDCKVYFHKLGTPVADDVVVYQRPDHPTEQFDLALTPDGRYLVITVGDGQVGDRSQEQIVVLDLTKPHAAPQTIVDRYDAEYLFCGNDGPQLFFKTTLDAPTKRIVAIDLRAPGRDHWGTIVPSGADAIRGARVTGGQLFVARLKDAHSTVTSYDLRGRKLRDVALPGLGTIYGFAGLPEARETFYFFTGLTEPGAVYRYDLASGKSTLWKQTHLPFDATQLDVQQIFFASKDGTKVPMFVTSKKGIALDGTHPTIMTGYGQGGIPLLPYFDASIIAWVERGGVYAIVSIRGGGEYGEAWHRAAMREHRQTGFDDFIAAGEWLVAHRYTSPAHLGNTGTSGGGMLVGAVTMQRPDLFGASVPVAGVHDLLRFHLFGQGAGWQGDLGEPSDATQFANLRRISPLHNVRPGTIYPAMLVVTEDHDVRVAPLHSYKLAAALQAAQAGPGRILLRVQTESGHGGGSMLSQEIEQQTEIMAFLAQNLGLPLP